MSTNRYPAPAISHKQRKSSPAWIKGQIFYVKYLEIGSEYHESSLEATSLSLSLRQIRLRS